MRAIAHSRLTRAVAAICPDIQAQVASHNRELSERYLWWELSCCLLSSRVPYSLAVAAAETIDRHELLWPPSIDGREIASTLLKVLSEPMSADTRGRAYRFPNVRAVQLAATRSAVFDTADSLESLLGSFESAATARAWFVAHAPGVGPKQASMFLRNIGFSYDLAVLDRHVLNYMAVLRLSERDTRPISGLAHYYEHEQVLRSHASDLGLPVGLLDWAIWIVMRAARSIDLERASR